MKFTTALASVALLASANAQTIVEVAESTGNHATLVSLVTQAGLADTLNGDGPLTVFAPTNQAFTDLAGAADKFTTPAWSAHLSDILLYHAAGGQVMAADLTLNQVLSMANGGTANITSLEPPMIKNANINPADVPASNGVVHVIDAVLLPTSVTSNIVEIASGAESFSTLVSLVDAADLVGTLSGEGPFTVFAPPNSAFDALSADQVAYLTSPEGKDDLTKILTYHVYAGIVYEAAVPDGTVPMVSGDNATVTSDPPTIAGVAILPGQILANNGVIHQIDSVILPPGLTLPSGGDAAATTDAPGAGEELEGTEGSGAVSVGSVFALASAAVAMLF